MAKKISELPAATVLAATDELEVNNGGTSRKATPRQIVAAGGREVLSAARTYYVATTGSDSNSGLVVGSPFLTLQKAINSARAVDANGFQVTIQVSNGTYNAGFIMPGPMLDGGQLAIVGNAGTPSSVVINATNSNCAVFQNGARASISGFRFQTTTAGSGIFAQLNASVEFSAIDFAACASDHILAVNGATVTAVGNYSLSAGCVNHWHAYDHGIITVQNRTVTITGSPTVTRWAGVATGGVLNSLGCTFSGAVTGTRYLAHRLSIINTEGSGATYLPGTVAGTADGATGGYYI